MVSVADLPAQEDPTKWRQTTYAANTRLNESEIKTTLKIDTTVFPPRPPEYENGFLRRIPQ
jgi:hypothetical protein